MLTDLAKTLRAMHATATPVCSTEDGRTVVCIRATADRAEDLLRAAAELEARAAGPRAEEVTK